MRDLHTLISQVNDDIAIVAVAKKELRDRTIELVNTMQTEGKTRQEGSDYIETVCMEVDDWTAKWARQFFDEAWPATAE